MPINDLRPISMDSLDAGTKLLAANWLWHGYLAPGDVTLLTSMWKTGKTTLLAGVLQQLGTGEPFLGREVSRGRAWIVSEESLEQWRERNRILPLGGHVQLLARPFRGRPTSDEWNRLIDQATEARVRFFSNGTSDELTLVLQSDKGEMRKITLEPMTGHAEVEILR